MVAFRFRTMDPWRELRELRHEMNQVFESAFGRRERPYPACNVWTSPDDVLVTCELPGVALDDLNISVMGNTLTLAGERKPAEDIKENAYHRHERGVGAFSRTVELPARVDAEDVEAHFKNGVLEIRLPKAAEEKSRKIEIKSA